MGGGGDTASNQAALQGVGSGVGSLPVSAYSCADWNEADSSERLNAIDRIAEFAGGTVSGEGVQGRGSVLPQEQAYDLFEKQCEPAYAGNFRLYKLYTQA